MLSLLILLLLLNGPPTAWAMNGPSNNNSSSSRNNSDSERVAITSQASEAAAVPAPLLALPGPRYAFNASTGGLSIGDAVIRVATRSNSGEGTAYNIWDGAFQLAKYLELHAAALLCGNSVLEVGSGCGLVGLAAATLGASHVTLTDMESVVPHLIQSIVLNPHIPKGHITASTLDWFAPHAYALGNLPVDVILGADVVWVEELIPPLVQTLAYLTRGNGDGTIVLLAHQTRSHSGDALLYSLLADAGFVVRTIDYRELALGYNSRDIDILELRRVRGGDSATRDPAEVAQ